MKIKHSQVVEQQTSPRIHGIKPKPISVLFLKPLTTGINAIFLNRHFIDVKK